jgi:hypothetical protein
MVVPGTQGYSSPLEGQVHQEEGEVAVTKPILPVVQASNYKEMQAERVLKVRVVIPLEQVGAVLAQQEHQQRRAVLEMAATDISCLSNQLSHHGSRAEVLVD